MMETPKRFQVVIIATHLATIYLLSIPPNILQKILKIPNFINKKEIKIVNENDIVSRIT
jgi:hypothetical protein